MNVQSKAVVTVSKSAAARLYPSRTPKPDEVPVEVPPDMFDLLPDGMREYVGEVAKRSRVWVYLTPGDGDMEVTIRNERLVPSRRWK